MSAEPPLELAGRETAWPDAATYVRKQFSADHKDFDATGYFFDRRLTWIECVKALRSLRGYSIQEADCELLFDVKWRRYAVKHANMNARCRLRVWQHIKRYGDQALLGYKDDKVFDRIEDTGRRHDRHS